ncbi:MAG: HEAT repeat domain-containing protein [Elusimicrobia bacterium]|nr:HEAT repeat domain-containing protein [Elusimicrobiota bacterium]
MLEIYKGLSSQDGRIRLKASKAAEKLGEEDAPAVAKALLKGDKDVYKEIASSLTHLPYWLMIKKYGDGRKAIVPALEQRLASKDPEVRYAAAAALGNIEPPLRKKLLPTLIEALQSDTLYPLSAAVILGEMGPEAKDAVPALVKAMKREDSNAIFFYHQALVNIGTREALRACKWYGMGRLIYKPYLYLSDKPVPNFLITFGFISLFWWSRRLRRAGIRLIHWPLLISVAAWIFNSITAVEGSREVGVPFGSLIFSPYISPFILIGTLAGLVPWLASVLYQRRRLAGIWKPPPMASGLEPAGFWPRFGAFTIDWLCSSSLFLAFALAAKIFVPLEEPPYLVLLCLLFAVPVLYHTITVGRWGRGLGKRFAGIAVAAPDGSRISYKRAFLRAWARYLSTGTFCLGYLAGFFRDKNWPFMTISPEPWS